jgi:hypothetical protein
VSPSEIIKGYFVLITQLLFLWIKVFFLDTFVLYKECADKESKVEKTLPSD